MAAQNPLNIRFDVKTHPYNFVSNSESSYTSFYKFKRSYHSTLMILKIDQDILVDSCATANILILQNI